jgi:tight adherence protein C
MIGAAVTITFVAALVVTLTLVYTLSDKSAIVASRMGHLWHRPTADEPSDFRKKQMERTQRILADIGKLGKPSDKAISRTAKLLVHAAYRRSEAPLIFRGVKFLLIIILLGAVYITGAYRQNMFYLVVAGMVGFLAPDLWLTRKVRRRKHQIQLALPDALDLMVVCIDAGLGLDQAILRVSEELRFAHPVLSEELQLMNLELRIGKTRADALRGLSARTGVDDIQALVAMLIQTERFGTSIAQSLRVHSDNLRTKRRQRAEERAAKAPVKMVPVLVFFIFPALFVVILGPAVITVMRQLIPMLHR